MILADSSTWVDHLRQGDTLMKSLLQTNRILIHPFVIGEISLGQLPRRAKTLFMLNRMSKAIVSKPEDVQFFIDRHKIFGSGIGYVDAHLLVSTRLTAELVFGRAIKDCVLWRSDCRSPLTWSNN